MSIWKQPHISKIYEALGAIGDNRIEIIEDRNEAKVYSSSRNKFYTVLWNDDLSQMMTNDSSAYWQGNLSYPMIAILLLRNKIQHNPTLPKLLKGFEWKEINTRFKNDYDKTVEFILEEIDNKGGDSGFIQREVGKIFEEINEMGIEPLGNRTRPPREVS